MIDSRLFVLQHPGPPGFKIIHSTAQLVSEINRAILIILGTTDVAVTGIYHLVDVIQQHGGQEVWACPPTRGGLGENR